MSSTVISSYRDSQPDEKESSCCFDRGCRGPYGRIGAVNHMKAPELKPIEKEPLKVRFVKIQEPPKPLPPKPKEEPKKEPTKPKEVKIVEGRRPTTTRKR